VAGDSGRDDFFIARLCRDYFFSKRSDYDRFMELGGIVSRLMQTSVARRSCRRDGFIKAGTPAWLRASGTRS